MNKEHPFYKSIQEENSNRFFVSAMYCRPYLLDDYPEAIALFNLNNTMLNHEEVKILVEGLTNFLKVTTEEEVAEQNQKQIEYNCISNRQNQESEANPVKIRKQKPGYVYFVKDNNGHCKIGLAKDVSKRMGEYTQLPYEPILVHTIKTIDMVELEIIFHEMFKSKRLRGEWFDLNEIDYKFITSKKYLKNPQIKKLIKEGA